VKSSERLGHLCGSIGSRNAALILTGCTL
jgi:hypothetical protein